MLRLLCTSQENRLVLTCDWCQEPILEDSQGMYMWKIPQQLPTLVNIVCVHFHCSHAYDTTHHIDPAAWCWEPLSRFSTSLQLEQRHALHDIGVLVKPAGSDEGWGFRPERSDQYVTILAAPKAIVTSHTLTLDGGFVTFDVDDQKCLIAIEINYGREGWIVNPNMPLPSLTGYHQLYFPDIRYRHEWIEDADGLRCSTDKDHRWLFLAMGVPKKDCVWVALSATCGVLLEEGYLRGVFAWLVTPPESTLQEAVLQV